MKHWIGLFCACWIFFGIIASNRNDDSSAVEVFAAVTFLATIFSTAIWGLFF